MTFLDGQRRIADEKDINAPWLGGKKGEYFKCCFCGKKIKLGDGWRVIYTNHIKEAPGNPLICDDCFITKEDAIEKWKKMHEEIRTKFWWFNK